MKVTSFGNLIPLVGGFSFGAQKAFGLTPSFTASFEDFAGNDQYHGVDIHLGESRIDTEHTLPQVDVICAVPPCSSLSSSNRHAGFNVGSGCHMYNAIRVALLSKPKIYIFENAPEMVSKKDIGRLTRAKLASIADEFGYDMAYVFTNSYNFDLPQNRRRSYAVAFPRGECPMNLSVNETVKLGEKRIDHDVTKLMEDDLVTEGDEARSRMWVVNKIRERFDIDVFAHEYPGTRCFMRILEKIVSTSEIQKLGRHLFEIAEKEAWSWNALREMRDCAKRMNGVDGFGYSPILVMGCQYSNVIFQQSLRSLMYKERMLTQPEVSRLMGMPEEYETMHIPEWRRVLTQNCPVHTNAKVLEFVTE